jgi:phosphate transport system protein
MTTLEVGPHIVHRFDQELQHIRDRVLAMGGLVEEQIANALKALMEGNGELGESVVIGDYQVNAMEVSLDEECTQILARRQAVAGDLRLILAVEKAVTDLERMGDEAEGIARMAARLAGTDQLSSRQLNGIVHLGEMVSKMVHEALDAFARLDVEAAIATAQQDTKIDREYDSTLRQLSTYMIEDPRNISKVLNVCWSARALERIGDHAKNICEYVVYLVKGKDVRHTTVEQMEEVVRGKRR